MFKVSSPFVSWLRNDMLQSCIMDDVGIVKWCPHCRLEPLCVGPWWSCNSCCSGSISRAGRPTSGTAGTRGFRGSSPIGLEPRGVGAVGGGSGQGPASAAGECLQWLDGECGSGWAGGRGRISPADFDCCSASASWSCCWRPRQCGPRSSELTPPDLDHGDPVTWSRAALSHV